MEPVWLAKARSYVGFHETGSNLGIEEFIAGAHTGSLGDPWCAIFANFCLETTGYSGTRSALARSFESSDHFVRLPAPQVGCIVTYWRGSVDSGQGHVDFFTGLDSNGQILGLGGNQSDGVNIAPQQAQRVTGYWWPADHEKATGLSSGKGSWYSQFPPDWVDTGDRPNSNALQVTDNLQGLSFYHHETLGDWFELHLPNGRVSIEQQTDIGPAPWTNKLVDVSAACAARNGYTPKNFPTGAIFEWKPIPVPKQVAGLSPQQQAVEYNKIRNTIMTDQPDTPVQVPAVQPQINEGSMFQFITQFAPRAKRALTVGVPLYNTLNPKDQIKPADIFPDGAPAQPASTPILGSEHAGILGLLTTLLLQAGNVVGPAVGTNATTTGSILTMLFGGLAGAGTITKIAPTIKTVIGIAAKIFAIMPK